MNALRTLAASALVILLGACATAPKTMYHWEGYQSQVYAYLKGDTSSPLEQLALLEAQAEKARATGAVLPPGFRAHLAMLYLRLDRPTEAKQALEAEKTAFPESAQYMDFALKSLGEKPSDAKGT